MTNKLKVYYAHGMNIYDTPQEKRDHELLRRLGFDVICPNTGTVKNDLSLWKFRNPSGNTMEFFQRYIQQADCVAFRAHPAGDIPSGVAYEVRYAQSIAKPIFELPTILSNRMLSLEDTRAYLEYLGQR